MLEKMSGRMKKWAWAVFFTTGLVACFLAGMPQGSGAAERKREGARAPAVPAGGNAVPSGYGMTGDSPKAHVGFYVTTYGVVDPKTNPLVERAYKIFENIRLVADKRSQRLPQLKIIDSDGDPWAVCLPDGYVVLSRKSVENCYQGTTPEVGDARIAFILGHELGHMADDDFWHLRTFMALSGDPQCERVKKILEKSGDVPTAEREQQLAIACGKEMKADDQGFLYAGMAGYRIETLVSGDKGDQDFFTYWMKQVPHAGVDKQHPTPEDRAQFLRTRLAGLLDRVEFFKFGVRLSYFGKYEDAVYFFREFQESFPSREVMNNLGFCHLKMALDQMDPSEAYRYWLPAVLDVQTRAESFQLKGVRGGASELSEAARQNLQAAADYFMKACEMDRTYLPSRVNLAVMLEERGRSGKAQEIWGGLAKDAEKLPTPYCEVVSRKSSQRVSCQVPEKKTARVPGSLPVEIGMDILKQRNAGTLFAGWKETAFNWQKDNLSGHFYHKPDGPSVLELDGYVEMIVLAGSQLGTADDLRKSSGPPVYEKAVGGGSLWSYGPQWTAYISDGRVREIWVARQQ